MNKNGQSSVVRFGLGLAVFISVISGPISGYFLGRVFLEAKASEAWPAVVATLTKAQVRETGFGRYAADVAYAYRVGNAEYIGTRIQTTDGEYGVRDGAIQALGELAVGEQIPVYHDPANPRQAVLNVGAGFQEYALLLVPFGMLGFGLRSYWLLRRTRPVS